MDSAAYFNGFFNLEGKTDLTVEKYKYLMAISTEILVVLSI